MFLTFCFIWWTGSRKLVIENVPFLPCLTKTWSNHIHCQASCSLGLFLWGRQLRIDFNKIQYQQQIPKIKDTKSTHTQTYQPSTFQKGNKIKQNKTKTKLCHLKPVQQNKTINMTNTVYTGFSCQNYRTLMEEASRHT